MDKAFAVFENNCCYYVLFISVCQITFLISLLYVLLSFSVFVIAVTCVGVDD